MPFVILKYQILTIIFIKIPFFLILNIVFFFGLKILNIVCFLDCTIIDYSSRMNNLSFLSFFGERLNILTKFGIFRLWSLGCLVGPITVFIKLRNTIVCSHYRQIILSNENSSLIIITERNVNQLGLTICNFAY